MEALNREFANIYSLLIIIIALIQFGHNAKFRSQHLASLFWENRCPYRVCDSAIK